MFNKINLDLLANALRRLSVETGSISCFGCGYEHNCGIHGCKVIRLASEVLKRSSLVVWYSADTPPTDDLIYLVVCKTKAGAVSINRAWFDGQCWHGSGSMAGVTHWANMPQLP